MKETIKEFSTLRIVLKLVKVGMVFLPISVGAQTQTKESADLLKNLSYPELQVTPRASDRLHMEKKSERSEAWLRFWPVQISAVATLGAGLIASGDYPDTASPDREDNVDWASRTAIATGAVWLAASTYMALTYRPYHVAYGKNKKQPAGNQREQLTKERLAEEALADAAQMGRRVRFLSFLTNFLASGYVAASGDKKSQIAGGLGAVLSLAPLIFRSHWEGVHKTHKLYKKRIYGPVASAFVVPDHQGQNQIVPALTWNFRF